MGFDYACFRIFAMSLYPSAAVATMPAGYRFGELSLDEVRAAPDAQLRACEEYGGQDAFLFGIFDASGTLASVQCIWHGERYRAHEFWPLALDEAASMHLVTLTTQRGMGLATHLKRLSAEQLRLKGFSRLYSRIWWTNVASLRVSEKAGWSRVGTTLQVTLPGMRRPLDMAFGKSRKPCPR